MLNYYRLTTEGPMRFTFRGQQMEAVGLAAQREVTNRQNTQKVVTSNALPMRTKGDARKPVRSSMRVVWNLMER